MAREGFPTFKEGMTQWQLSAAQMNRLSAAARKADNLKVGAGLQTRNGTAGSLVFVAPTQPGLNIGVTRFVAVVVPPTQTDTLVMVREIAYAIEEPEEIPADPEPIKGEYTYRWASSHRILARPGYGYVPMDFAAMVFEDEDAYEDEIDPTADTPVLWLERRVEGPPLLWPLQSRTTRQFKIVGVYGTYLVCRTWAGSVDTQGEDMVEVARPWFLQAHPEPYNRDGIRYTYEPSRPQWRLATRTLDNESEEQVIVPRYRPGDVIYATTGIAGGLDAEWAGSLPFSWLDDNRDGRAWAKKDESSV